MNRDSVASEEQGETAITLENGQDRRFYLTREPVILAVLSALAIAFFLAVTGLSHLAQAQQQSLGSRWFARGSEALEARNFQPAVSDFRTALMYSRDNYAYQFNLAEALLGEGRSSEAHTYLVNLWEREPENGQVNLELARVAAHNAETEQALRYYHNAIYATWPGNQEVERRDTRLELVKFLLGINARPQAESELVALAANLDNDPSQHARIGELFFEVRDYEHALGEFMTTLKSEPQNPSALAGAGRAAFALGRYPQALQFLQAAVRANPGDEQLAEQLKDTALVLQIDPFRRWISLAQRNRIVIEAFTAAGKRLEACAAAGNASGPASSAGSQQNLTQAWTAMQPQITERNLRRKPELVESAMELVFDIERRSNAACGAPTGIDMALLLISKSHEGN